MEARTDSVSGMQELVSCMARNILSGKIAVDSITTSDLGKLFAGLDNSTQIRYLPIMAEAIRSVVVSEATSEAKPSAQVPLSPHIGTPILANIEKIAAELTKDIASGKTNVSRIDPCAIGTKVIGEQKPTLSSSQIGCNDAAKNSQSKFRASPIGNHPFELKMEDVRATLGDLRFEQCRKVLECGGSGANDHALLYFVRKFAEMNGWEDVVQHYGSNRYPPTEVGDGAVLMASLFNFLTRMPSKSKQVLPSPPVTLPFVDKDAEKEKEKEKDVRNLPTTPGSEMLSSAASSVPIWTQVTRYRPVRFAIPTRPSQRFGGNTYIPLNLRLPIERIEVKGAPCMWNLVLDGKVMGPRCLKVLRSNQLDLAVRKKYRYSSDVACKGDPLETFNATVAAEMGILFAHYIDPQVLNAMEIFIVEHNILTSQDGQNVWRYVVDFY